MSDARNDTTRNGRLIRALPWLIGAVGLIIYVVTLNRWVSLTSLGTVAGISQWNWQPQWAEPLTIVLLSPFRLLPESWAPLALNIFAAVCASLVLVLLARSVLLLLDRRGFQADRDPGRLALTHAAWLAPVLAAAACGLQVTFWEEATSMTGGSINLLVFAAIVWCLLEFRLWQKQAWLSASAFLYGIGVTNNFALIVYFPLFLAGIIWLKGLKFFDVRFLIRMLLPGLAGLSLYFLMPAIYGFSTENHVGFWAALKDHLKLQKLLVASLPKGALLPLAVIACLPILARFARPQSDFRLAVLLTRTVHHFVLGVFLLISLLIFFDPPFSPRALALGGAWMNQYYLYALVAGYCSGHFILVSAKSPRWLRRSVAGATCFLLAVIAAGLVNRNLGEIRFTNGPALRQFAAELCSGLPKGPSVVLSDDAVLLFLAREEIICNPQNRDPIFLDTRALLWSRYHSFMSKRFKARWPAVVPKGEQVDQGGVVTLISEFLAKEEVTYLNPSFGYYFERLTERPHRLVYNLFPRVIGVSRESYEAAVLADEGFYAELWEKRMRDLTRWIDPKADSQEAGWFRRLWSETRPNPTAEFLGAMYSRSLDDWGVRMLRAGKKVDEAGPWFERALQLKPANFSAWLNLKYLQQRREGKDERMNLEALGASLPETFGNYRNWPEILGENGPIDEPGFLFEMGRVWYSGRNYHQAAAAFGRSAELLPRWIEARLWQAQSHVAAAEFETVLAVTDGILASGLPPDAGSLGQWIFCRSRALQGLSRTNEATAALEAFVREHREQAAVLSAAAQFYLAAEQFEPALRLLEEMAAREPTNPDCLLQKGFAELRLNRSERAIQTLTLLLSLQPTNQVALLDRAAACLQAGNQEGARGDYQQLLGLSPESQAALFGLGEVALRGQDTNSAIGYYRQSLTFCSPASAEHKRTSRILERLSGFGDLPEASRNP